MNTLSKFQRLIKIIICLASGVMEYDKVSENEEIHIYSLPASKSLVQWAAYKESGDNQTSTMSVLYAWERLYAPGESEKQEDIRGSMEFVRLAIFPIEVSSLQSLRLL